jgi:geranylgeranylglycerol-phosphate geranylgeranyltransferase
MSLLGAVKDHVLIGGPNAVSGWGLLVLLVFSGGVVYQQLAPGVNSGLFLLVLAAAAATGNGVYAINAVYDVEADKVNKPNRPLPSGRMTRQHALKYAYGLMVTGLAVAAVVCVLRSNYVMFVLWSLFTILGIAYSMPPLKLKARHILGNICFGAFAGLSSYIGLSFAGVSSLASLSSRPVIFQIYFLLAEIVFVGGVVTMKDFQDYEGDKKNRDMTIPARFGRRAAALIALVMMIPFAARIPIIPYGTLYQPPVYDFFLRNMGNWVLMAGFVVYIILDIKRPNHFLSDAYSRWMYYFMILYTAYGFVKTSILPQNIATSPWITVVGIDAYIALVIYVAIATVTIYMSLKKERDILKPT